MADTNHPESTESRLPSWQSLLQLIKERNELFAEYRRKAGPVLAALLALPADQREAAVIADPRQMGNPSLIDLLLERSHQALFEDPAEATSLARLAVSVARSLEAERVGSELVRDLELRAEAHLGNALRVQGELRAASATFHALKTRRAEVADPLLVAEILSLLASLRQDQGRLSEASRLLDQAHRIYVGVGDQHLAARARLKKANVLDQQDRLDAAISMLRDCMLDLDLERDPELVMTAHHNLACCLSEAGRFEEAKAVLGSNPLRARRAPATYQLRQLWLQGKVAAGEGRIEEAAVSLGNARDGFLTLSLAYDAALVSFDLAAAHAAAGRTQQVRDLAEEMVATFSALDLDRQALAALRLFLDAARTDALSVEAVRFGARTFRLAHLASPLGRG